jgi:hypothetical protein
VTAYIYLLQSLTLPCLLRSVRIELDPTSSRSLVDLFFFVLANCVEKGPGIKICRRSCDDVKYFPKMARDGTGPEQMVSASCGASCDGADGGSEWLHHLGGV